MFSLITPVFGPLTLNEALSPSATQTLAPQGPQAPAFAGQAALVGDGLMVTVPAFSF